MYKGRVDVCNHIIFKGTWQTTSSENFVLFKRDQGDIVMTISAFPTNNSDIHMIQAHIMLVIYFIVLG